MGLAVFQPAWQAYSMRTVAVSVLSGLVCGIAFGQDAGTHFEVASVRPAAPQQNGVGTRGGPGTPDPGRMTYTNVNLRVLLDRAYDVLDDQISGPPWLATERYDISATIPSCATKEQFQAMLQNLLAERFQLAFHREKKEFVVYELLAAKAGSKLKEGSLPAESKPASTGRGGPVDSKGFAAPPAHQTGQTSTDGVAKMGANQITMAAFAQFLTFPVGFMDGSPMLGMGTARVVDKTGLTGEYSFTLEYEWPGQKPADAPGDLAPVLFTALQQQLGLRLEKTKQMLDVLVIDRAEKTPTEN